MDLQRLGLGRLSKSLLVPVTRVQPSDGSHGAPRKRRRTWDVDIDIFPTLEAWITQRVSV